VAKNKLLYIIQTPEERARLRSHRIWLQDREHVVAVAREEGIENLHPSKWGPALYSYDAVLTHRNELIDCLEAEIVNKNAEIAALRAQLDSRQ